MSVCPQPCGLSPRVRGNQKIWRVQDNQGTARGLSPRVRGNPGRNGLAQSSKAICGLSPRVRGNLRGTHLTSDQVAHRSIPACAGEPASKSDRSAHCITGSIPACAGEPRGVLHVTEVCMRIGLSPRVRGNPLQLCPNSSCRKIRSIPACAGEPHLQPLQTLQVKSRSIPACAGEPFRWGSRAKDHNGVYPRVCGGTPTRPLHEAEFSAARSIPACAGEPSLECGIRYQRLKRRVYPRVCGGTRVSPRRLPP